MRDRLKRFSVAAAIVASGAVVGLVRPATGADQELSETAAYTKAQSFFASHVGCGALGDIRDAGDRWAIEAQVGYEGDLDPHPVFVDKNTGEISWESLEVKNAVME